ncbi:MAG: cytochrome c maturation protein CcmE [Saprospiraceae bacterium]|nr:cytochrome c maturation protein CcmE [Bacteroidia bacterium]NNL93476.1 cytochrome c maturation protein CcmE [Saprospiraceae bacterium]
MKKTYYLAIIAIAVAIFIIIVASKDVTTYASFSDAAKTENSVKITGQLDLDEDIIYKPEIDPNVFSFHLIDDEGMSKKVIMKKPKPQDFERSESIVVTGKMQGENFVANEILMKCPSKYKDDEIRLRAEI